jgi:hypothetical protein
MRASMPSLLHRGAWRLEAPSLDVSARQYWLLLAALLAVAALAQLVLTYYGLYSISNDESERSLVAYHLTWSGAFEASYWPPLPKIINGLALALYPDLFVTPRIVVGVAGLATLGALVFTTRRLFDNRLIALIAGMLAIFLPQRLILSVVPLSNIFGYLLVTIAAGFLAGWLRGKGNRELFLSSFFLLLAAAVRLEVWFINAALGLYLAYRTLVRRDVSWPVFIGNGVLLAAFPSAWILHIYVQTGSLELLTFTRRQFLDFAGHDYALALKSNVLYVFAMDVVLGPVLALGALALAYLSIVDRAIRGWAIVLFAPLAVIAIDMLASWSVPLGAPFRVDAIWLLLLAPFGAWALVVAAERLGASRPMRLAAAAALTYLATVPFVLNTRDMVHLFHRVSPVITSADLALSAELKRRLSQDSRQVLLDATNNLDYLDVIVLANAPDRFILNVEADPVLTAGYSWTPEAYIRRGDTAIVNTYLTDKFHIAEGLDMERVQARNIGYVLVRNSDYVRALRANPRLSEAGSYGRWVLFELSASH